MKQVFLIALISIILCHSFAFASDKANPETLMKQAREARDKFNYTSAVKLIDEARKAYRAMNDMEKLNGASAEMLQLQKVQMEYALSEADLYKMAEQDKIPISREEISKLIKENALESMMLDGEKKYYASCLTNAFFRDPSLMRRSSKALEGSRKFVDNYRWLIYNQNADPDDKALWPYRNPQVFLGKAKLKIEKKELPSKGTLKVWIPFPISSTSQSDVRLLSVSLPDCVKCLPDSEKGIGCIYMELPLPLKKDEITIEYLFKQYEVSFSVDPGKVGEYDRGSEMYRHYTRSDDNCTVTPEIKALAEEIAAGEKNPYLAAKKIYDYVTYNVKYSLMPHLSLGALGKPESVYVFEHRYGDCGAQSLFFSALCRSIGIPARCSGGMQLSPGINSCHFWAQVYIPNYGWIPADTSVGQIALNLDNLTSQEKRAFTDYFFGHMDPYRFYIQSETDLDLYPPMGAPRVLKLAFQFPDAFCDGCESNPALLIKYETSFKRVE